MKSCPFLIQRGENSKFQMRILMIKKFFDDLSALLPMSFSHCSLGETAIVGGFALAGIFIIILVFLLHKTARFTGTR